MAAVRCPHACDLHSARRRATGPGLRARTYAKRHNGCRPVINERSGKTGNIRTVHVSVGSKTLIKRMPPMKPRKSG